MRLESSGKNGPMAALGTPIDIPYFIRLVFAAAYVYDRSV